MRCFALNRRNLLFPSAKPTIYAQLRVHSSSSAQIISPLYGLIPLIQPIRDYSTSQKSLPRGSKASLAETITYVLLLLGAGVWIQHQAFKKDTVADASTRRPSAQPISSRPFLGVINTLNTMSGEVPPGTVGNLTPEQEAKLQELWILLMKVCGVKNGDAEEDDSGTSSLASPVPEKRKKQKRRFGLFGKKDEEAEKKGESGSSSINTMSIADGDDKYGQSKEFQQALVDMKPEDLRDTLWNMVKSDNPDALLLRFLRARKWDVNKALVMLVSTVRWRCTGMKVDDEILPNGEALAKEQSDSSDPAEKQKGEEFLSQIRMGKSFLHGVDKFGRPMCVVRVRLHHASEQSVDVLERYTVYTIESARMMLSPPVETATIIFDMTDFTLANMDYTPVKFMIRCFEANYPESLGCVLVHKAPWIFSGIWSIIKGWLDPVVAAKVHFTKNVEDLEEFIPRERIVKELGGDEDWDYEYVEVKPDENIQMKDTSTRDALISAREELVKAIQDATFSWISASTKDDKEALLAIKKRRDQLIAELRSQYWKLDPYVRARSFYDRIGVIQGGGNIDFYPEKAEIANGTASAEERRAATEHEANGNSPDVE